MALIRVNCNPESHDGFSLNSPLRPKSKHPAINMIAKFDIEYVVRPQHNKRVDIHRTNDPVAVEDFLTSLLASGSAITAIKHEGVSLSQHQADQMIRVAA